MARNQRLELTWSNKDRALIPTENGRYGYTWVDPHDPRYSETHTLVVDEVVRGVQSDKEEGTTYSERADLEPQDGNLLILGESGDVLEALTRVPEWRDKYVGKVKCIYIDPPFNTAQTFANYEDNLEHSVWLTMMRDRLIHLRDLLSDDGSIWVHLDDVENHRMRLVMDEVFGAGNFVAEVQWEKVYSPRPDARKFSSRNDTILVYAFSSAVSINPMQKVADQSQFKLVDENGRRYRSDPLRKWGSNSLRSDRPSMWFPITSPDGREVFPVKPDGTEGRWRWKKESVESGYHRLDWLDKGNGIQPYLRQYADESGTRPPETLWLTNETGHSQEAKEEVKALFPGVNPFATPKPERLLERIIHIATNPGDIVLDCFGGSGTTAAVAQKMGRRWVTCELVEDTFNRFTRPRLEKVVNDQDPGGITLTKGERIDATENGLPEGMEAEDAQRFTSLLNKLIKDDPEMKKNPVVKDLKARAKTTKTKDTVNWRGGGGFTIAHLSPTCFDYVSELGKTTLTEHATGETLIDSVAANLGFHRTRDDLVFHGTRGKQRLAVVEGRLTRDKVDEINTHRGDDEGVVFAALMLEEGVREYVRSLKSGSRVVVIPSDIFPATKEGAK